MLIFKPRQKFGPLLAEEATIRYQAKLKYTQMKGMVPGFVHAEKVGEDRTKLRVEPREPRRGSGLRTTSYAYLCDNTAAGLKSVMRKVRPEEEAQIAALDDRIAAHQAEIALLQAQRIEVVREAWTKAHVVHLKDIEIRSAV